MEQLERLLSKWLIVILCAGMVGCKESGTKNSLIPTNAIQLSKADNALHNLNGTIYYKGKPFTGTVFLCYPNQLDTLLVEKYLNGLEHGEWKKYYPAHQFKEQRYFDHGKKVGNYFTWWENGKLQFHYQLMNDEYEGVCKEWNQQGRLTKEMHYVKGHESGKQQWWYDNGKIKANYTIIDGRRFGLLGTKNCVNVSDSIFKY